MLTWQEEEGKETERATSLVTILLRVLILYEDSSLMTWFWSWPEQNLNIFQKLISKYCHLGIRAWIYGWRDNIEYIISFNSKSHRLWREGPQRKTKQIIFNWKRVMFSFLPRSLQKPANKNHFCLSLFNLMLNQFCHFCYFYLLHWTLSFSSDFFSWWTVFR